MSGSLLCASVLIEAVYSTFAALHFIVTRKAQRERFTAMLLGQRRLAALALAASLPLLSVGCTTFPGASFGDQLDQLSWTAEALASGDGRFEDVLLDFHSMFIGDLSAEPLAETFEQFGW